MLDHIGLTVRNVPTSRRFYVQALAPLGYAVAMEISEAEAGVEGVGLGEAGKPEIWLMGGATATTPRVHLAFRAADRATVDAFYRAAMAAGATDNGPPGLRPEYHPDYYGAFVLDPDGHNVEAVCHQPG